MPSADSPPPASAASDAQPLSPLPPAPTMQSPGYRATSFLELYEKTLSKTLRTISYDDFAACFPTMAENRPENVELLHKGMIGTFERLAKTDFEAILRERNVIENLNALDDLVADAKRKKARSVGGKESPVAPHLLPAPAIVAAHLAPQLASQQSQLNAKLQTLQSQNANILQTLRAQHGELEALVLGLERAVRDLEEANEGLNGEVKELRQVVREVDVDMRGF